MGLQGSRHEAESGAKRGSQTPLRACILFLHHWKAGTDASAQNRVKMIKCTKNGDMAGEYWRKRENKQAHFANSESAKGGGFLCSKHPTG